jgi:hypothetical protein
VYATYCLKIQDVSYPHHTCFHFWFGQRGSYGQRRRPWPCLVNCDLLRRAKTRAVSAAHEMKARIESQPLHLDPYCLLSSLRFLPVSHLQQPRIPALLVLACKRPPQSAQPYGRNVACCLFTRAYHRMMEGAKYELSVPCWLSSVSNSRF